MSSPKKPKPAPKKRKPAATSVAKTVIKSTATPVAVAKSQPKAPPPEQEEILFVREYWTGDSRDGAIVNGDGYHYYRITKSGKIIEAYEFYEHDDGIEIACLCPEMLNVHWLNDLGYEDYELLETVRELDFARIKELASGYERPVLEY